jgi:hypothetical protein
MEESVVNQVIASLSKIEKSAEGIKNDTEHKKTAYAREIEEKIKIYDEEMEIQHQKNMEKLKENLENEKKEAMLKMRADMAVEVGKLDEAYEKHHKELAQSIFEQMLKE